MSPETLKFLAVLLAQQNINCGAPDWQQAAAAIATAQAEIEAELAKIERG